MTRRIFAGLLCVGLLLGLCGLLQAQTATTGQVAGTIKDPSGAVIPGAKVMLTSAAGEQRNTSSDAEGHYRFVLLPPGTYKLTVDASGFKPFTVADIGVRITETTQVDAGVTLAAASESVNVSAAPPLVQSTSATAGRVIENAQVRQLPLPTRNFQQILALSPGTVAGLSNNTEMGRGDASIDVNGQRTTSNNVIVDGTEVNSPGTNSTGNLSVPAPDAIQEFIVQTSMYDATVGRNAGGNIAVVTKSGTNTIHGSAYEFLRNEKLNANDFFLNRANRPRPVLKRNQFGGTFGGALVKDKTFFFVSYQGTRERNGASLTNSLTFPQIPAGLTDDRSDAALNALAAAINPPPLVFSPIAKALLQAKLPNGQFAIPSAAGTSAHVYDPVNTPMSGISRFREDQFNVNIDQNLGAKNKLAGKFFFSDTPQYQSQFSFVGSNPYQVPGYGGFIEFHNRVFTLTDTHVFTANLINQFRTGFSRINGPSHPEEPFVGTPTAPAFGINNPLCTAGDTRFCGLPTIQVLGLFSIGSTTLADQRSTTETFNWSDMVSYTHGRHFLRFGADVTRYHVDFFFNFFSRGQINFNSFADFLQGKTAFGLLGNGVRDRAMRSTDYSTYLQDDVRVTDKLTLNLGARLTRNGGISEVKGRLANFDPVMFTHNTLPCTVAASCQFGFYTTGKGGTLNPSDWNLAPRFGFAFKPGAKNNFVVRGGMGVYFDRFSTRVANMQIFNYPFDVVGLSLGLPPTAFANPFPNLANVTFPISPAVIPSPIPFYFSGIPFPLLGQTPISGVYVDKNFRMPYVYQYNFGVQYEPFKDYLVDISYVGSKGTKLINVYTYNQGLLGTAPYIGSGFSTNKVLNGFQTVGTTGNSHYNSLQASLTKRFTKYLQFLGAYTFSKSIDEGSGAVGNELAALPGDQQNQRSQRGLSDFDRAHRFVLSFVNDLPKLYHGDAALPKKVLNDWELAGIMTFQSGTPFSVLCVSGSTLYNRADLAPGAVSVNVSGSTGDKLDHYFNTAAFAATCANAAPYGTSARNLLRGPGQKNVDLSVVKFFPVNERSKIEFRTEFFNAFNLVNFALPGNNVAVPGTLGKITSTAAGPRVIQFALKYSF